MPNLPYWAGDLAVRALTRPLGNGPPTNEAMLKVMKRADWVLGRMGPQANRFFETGLLVAGREGLERAAQGTATPIDLNRVEMLRRLLWLMGPRYRRTVGSTIGLGLKRGMKIDEKLAKEGKPRIITLALHVTSECPQKPPCPGCYRESSEEGSLEYDLLDSLVAQGIALGVRLVVLLGGEPLTRWDDLSRLVHKYNRTTFILATNGLLATKAVAEDAREASNVLTLFNVPGPADVTNSVRGHKRAWELLDRGIRTFQEAEAARGFLSTVYPINYLKLSSAEFGEQLDEWGMMLGMFFPCKTPSDCDPRPELEPTPYMMGRFSRRLTRLSDRCPVPLVNAYMAEEKLRFRGGCPARTGEILSIKPNGLAEACPLHTVTNRELDVRAHTLEQVLRHPYFAHLRDRDVDLGLCVGSPGLAELLRPWAFGA